MMRLFQLLLRGHPAETLYPKDQDDVQEILRQCKDNATSVRATGGTFPFTPLPEDIVVDMRYLDRLIGLDIYQQLVTVQAGMHLSSLIKILDTVALSLDISGRVPDMAVCDAIAVGTFGGSAGLLSSIVSVDIALASGKITTWSWERHLDEMRALCCGLGMAGVVLAVTFQCTPLIRYTEISYLCSIRDILEQWSIQLKASFNQQLLWFPFSEFMVMTHISPIEKYQIAKQPLLNHMLEFLGELCSRTIRKLSILTSLCLPLVSSILSRAQFFAHWSISKQRSDYAHSMPRFWAPEEACRGTSWVIPSETLPDVLHRVSKWTRRYPGCCVAPLFIQTVKVNQKMKKKPFLCPLLDEPSCAVWYDWFLPELEPDPIAIAEFEEIFYSAGGVRTWSGERLTSPLVLSTCFEKYSSWCKMKSRLDANNILQSAYIQGTVYTLAGIRSESTLSLCSSVLDAEVN